MIEPQIPLSFIRRSSLKFPSHLAIDLSMIEETKKPDLFGPSKIDWRLKKKIEIDFQLKFKANLSL